uniref:Uncharacterized protein n=1 Tax=Aegilops tauschii subsp. strangulata TaxID=200361 RepID=A0A452XTT0_AEGTS
MRSPYVQFWESIPAAERTGKRPFHLRQGCPDADHQRGVASSMPPGQLCNYTVKEEIGEVEPEICSMHDCVDMAVAMAR